MDQIDGFVADLREISLVVPVSRTPQGCRDPKDDVVVETALAGGAGILVTQDFDFQGSPAVLEVLTRAGTLILTPRQFVQILTTPQDRAAGTEVPEE
jgi:predicted nucleic acid-binding protein